MSDTSCGYCRRPWFGVVDYCPYCGRKPAFVIAMPAGRLPVISETIEFEQDSTATPQLGKTASPLLFKALSAGVIALMLLWMVVKLFASGTGEEASPTPPAPALAIAPAAVLRTENPVPLRPGKSPCSAAHQAAGLCTSQK